jgi:hypothetical protein
VDEGKIIKVVLVNLSQRDAIDMIPVVRRHMCAPLYLRCMPVFVISCLCRISYATSPKKLGVSATSDAKKRMCTFQLAVVSPDPTLDASRMW